MTNHFFLLGCRYQESSLIVSKRKTNLWFIGDGKGMTIITGSKSVKANNVTTLKTATFGKYTLNPLFNNNSLHN